jgi:anti-sigma factor RsiW
MTPALNHSDDADLFRRYAAEEGGFLPDETTLAAFAEGRLPASEAARVAAWLAIHPGAAEDVAMARTIARIGTPPFDALAERIAGRAAALVGGAEVVAFPAPRRRVFVWREAASWTALAATVGLAAWLGFALGGDTWSHYAASDDTGSAGLGELLDPPTGLLGSLSVDNGAT